MQPAVDDEAHVDAALAAFGLFRETAEPPKPPKPREPDPWHLWPENVATWELWLRLQTQWRHAGMAGQRTGLDYASVWALIDRLKVRRPRETFEHLQRMELTSLEVWDRRAAEEAERAAKR